MSTTPDARHQGESPRFTPSPLPQSILPPDPRRNGRKEREKKNREGSTKHDLAKRANSLARIYYNKEWIWPRATSIPFPFESTTDFIYWDSRFHLKEEPISFTRKIDFIYWKNRFHLQEQQRRLVPASNRNPIRTQARNTKGLLLPSGKIPFHCAKITIEQPKQGDCHESVN